MKVRFYLRDLFYLALASAIIAAWLSDNRKLDQQFQSVQAEIANSNLQIAKLTPRLLLGRSPPRPFRVYGIPLRIIGARSLHWREEFVEPEQK